MLATDPINPNEIGEVLNMLALSTDPGKKMTEERLHFALTAVVVSFLLAKKQPELADACVQYWDFTHPVKSGQLLDWWLDIYEAYRKAKQEKKYK